MESGAAKRKKLKENQVSDKGLLCKIPKLSNFGFTLLQDDVETPPVDLTSLTVSADDGVAKELGLGAENQPSHSTQNPDPDVLTFSNDPAKWKDDSLRVYWTRRGPADCQNCCEICDVGENM